MEQFRSSNGLYAGSNNVTLGAQQLSELNSQLILAKAQRSETEARARLIKKMLDEKSDIDATPEVLKSELIGRLIEQRAQVQRQLAELSATPLPSHPRLKQLNSELTDVRSQIRQEATKIVRGLENEAEVASARETSLRSSLNEVQSQASGQSDAGIKLRALEREAKANRDLLESYLARFRDASARHDMAAVPASATIVSRAPVSSKPSFPKCGPISALATSATALLALAFVLSRELIGGTAATGAASAPVTRGRFERVLGAVAADPSREQTSKPVVQRARSEAEAGAPNDLRSYLQRRAALQTRDQAKDVRRRDATASSVKGRARPVLKSLDVVLNHVRARSAGNTPREVLVVPVSTDVDATNEAIRIARALLAGKQRVVLVDLTRGAAAVSGRLGLPRAPGFADLVAGRADFEHVVHVDEETPLQVIPAGNPTVKTDGDDTERTTHIFEALAQAYDCIVLHADRETARKLEPVLDGRLQAVVAVLAPGESAKGGEEAFAKLTMFGCSVVPYEQTDGERRSGRSGLFDRAAAV